MKRETEKIIVPVVDFKGEKVKELELPDNIFGLKMNHDLVFQVVRILQLKNKKPIAHAKGRGEVSGGGIKPRPQKGTGRSRQGSIRSPLWKGGGVTHGPLNERNYDLKLNKRMKDLAFLQILSDKAKQSLIVVEGKIALKESKTKFADELMKKIFANKKIKRTLMAQDFDDKSMARSFYNLPYLKLISVKNLNILDLMNFPQLLLSEQSLNDLIDYLSQKTVAKK